MTITINNSGAGRTSVITIRDLRNSGAEHWQTLWEPQREDYHVLPFPSILVSGRSDPYLGILTAQKLTTAWGSQFVDAGAVARINVESGIGDWPFGQRLLEQLLNSHSDSGVASQYTGGASSDVRRLAHGR